MAEKQIHMPETARETDMKSKLKVVSDSEDTATWSIKKFPRSAREAAVAAAKRQGVTVAAFVAEAVLKHAGHTNYASDSWSQIGDCVASALQEYADRIEALENRLPAADAPLVPKPKAKVLVSNLVERPWLKHHD